MTLEDGASQISSTGVRLRSARSDEEDFLYSLFASTRRDEFQIFGWGEAQLDALIRMQFNAQSQHYRASYPNADHEIVCADDQPIGRILVDRSWEDILLIDIALLPDHRNAGIGGYLIGVLLDEAREQKRSVKLHVSKTNPARRLYERLGFSVVSDDGVYFEMICPPAKG